MRCSAILACELQHMPHSYQCTPGFLLCERERKPFGTSDVFTCKSNGCDKLKRLCKCTCHFSTHTSPPFLCFPCTSTILDLKIILSPSLDESNGPTNCTVPSSRHTLAYDIILGGENEVRGISTTSNFVIDREPQRTNTSKPPWNSSAIDRPPTTTPPQTSSYLLYPIMMSLRQRRRTR
jgi:hypothetical protein